MSPVKLIYFNVTALGEPIRYLLSYGGVEFEDERHTLESFQPLKDKMPLGQLPLLEYNGLKLFQTVPICRYLAKKFKLDGKDDEDSVRCDIAVDTVQDLRSGLSAYHYEKNEAIKKQKYDETMKKSAYLLEKLDGFLAKNGGTFLKDQISWADIFFAGVAGYLSFMAGKDLYTDKPNLKALKLKVEALPAISKYLEKRPAVPF